MAAPNQQLACQQILHKATFQQMMLYDVIAAIYILKELNGEWRYPKTVIWFVVVDALYSVAIDHLGQIVHL